MLTKHCSLLHMADFTSPTESPTLSPVTIDQFCEQFDFGGSIDPNEPNILERADDNPELSLITSLFQVAGLAEIFRCPGKANALVSRSRQICTYSQRLYFDGRSIYGALSSEQCFLQF